MTPSGGDKAYIRPEQVAIVKVQKQIIIHPGGGSGSGSGDGSGGVDTEATSTTTTTLFEGPCPPSMEWSLHVAAYEARPGTKAVLHAHSKTLMAFSLAQSQSQSNDDGRSTSNDDHDIDDPRVPNTKCLLGAWQVCGNKVAVAPYAMPGSQALADACRHAFASSGADCVVMKNHGVVVVGSSLHQAYDRFVSLEYLAASMVHAQALGVPLKVLDESTLDRTWVEPIPSWCPRPIIDQQRVLSGLEKTLRSELCTFVHRAYDQNLVTSSSGSFSVRLPTALSTDKLEKNIRTSAAEDISFLITPSAVDRKQLEASDICFLTTRATADKLHNIEKDDGTFIDDQSDGDQFQSQLVHLPLHHPQSPESVSPSRAARMHATVYRHHSDVHCILVTQPTCATAFCLTGSPLDASFLPESHVVLRDVACLSLEEALREDGIGLAEILAPPTVTTVLVQNYGVVTVGDGPASATCGGGGGGDGRLKTFCQLELLESMCSVTLQAKTRGLPLAPFTKHQKMQLSQAFLKHP